jgi:hypothetical protein
MYYAESRNLTTGCVSATRLPVTGFVKIYDTCIPGTFDLTGKVEFVNTQTYSKNNKTLSAPVKITVSKTGFEGGTNPNFYTDYSDHSINTDTYGSLFSRCMVRQYANVLCPSPWHVPVAGKFCQYINGSTTDTSPLPGVGSANGWRFGGYLTHYGSVEEVGSIGFYWSSTTDGTNKAYAARYAIDSYYNNLRCGLYDFYLASFPSKILP